MNDSENDIGTMEYGMLELAQVSVGMMVKLNTPENERLHNARARVTSVEEWGVHVDCAAAGSGKFRALFEEIDIADQVREQTGNVCNMCGGVNIVRTGTCMTCQDCGANSGCG